MPYIELKKISTRERRVIAGPITVKAGRGGRCIWVSTPGNLSKEIAKTYNQEGNTYGEKHAQKGKN